MKSMSSWRHRGGSDWRQSDTVPHRKNWRGCQWQGPTSPDRRRRHPEGSWPPEHCTTALHNLPETTNRVSAHLPFEAGVTRHCSRPHFHSNLDSATFQMGGSLWNHIVFRISEIGRFYQELHSMSRSLTPTTAKINFKSEFNYLNPSGENSINAFTQRIWKIRPQILPRTELIPLRAQSLKSLWW